MYEVCFKLNVITRVEKLKNIKVIKEKLQLAKVYLLLKKVFFINLM